MTQVIRTRYVEILAKEMAMSAAEERNYTGVKLDHDDKSLTVENLSVKKNTKLIEKVRKLSDEENKYLGERFQKEFDQIVDIGIRKMRVTKEVSKKWN